MRLVKTITKYRYTGYGALIEKEVEYIYDETPTPPKKKDEDDLTTN